MGVVCLTPLISGEPGAFVHFLAFAAPNSTPQTLHPGGPIMQHAKDLFHGLYGDPNSATPDGEPVNKQTQPLLAPRHFTLTRSTEAPPCFAGAWGVRV